MAASLSYFLIFQSDGAPFSEMSLWMVTQLPVDHVIVIPELQKLGNGKLQDVGDLHASGRLDHQRIVPIQDDQVILKVGVSVLQEFLLHAAAENLLLPVHETGHIVVPEKIISAQGRFQGLNEKDGIVLHETAQIESHNGAAQGRNRLVEMDA